MGSYPKITILTPTFNRATLLERSIQSVVSQNYSNLEYIIVDGGSTDGTLDVLNRYDNFITKWISEPDEGPMHAVLKGSALATGEYVFLLPSDDYLEPDILNSVGSILQTERCDVLHGNFIYYDTKHNSKFLCKPWRTSNEDIYNNRYKWPSVFLNTYFVKKMVYDQFFSKLNKSYIYAGDFETFQMLIDRQAYFRYLDKTFVNVSSGGISDNAFKGYFQIARISIDHGCSRVSAVYHLLTKLLSRSIASILLRFGLIGLRNRLLTASCPNIIKLADDK